MDRWGLCIKLSVKYWLHYCASFHSYASHLFLLIFYYIRVHLNIYFLLDLQAQHQHSACSAFSLRVAQRSNQPKPLKSKTWVLLTGVNFSLWWLQTTGNLGQGLSPITSFPVFSSEKGEGLLFYSPTLKADLQLTLPFAWSWIKRTT